MHKFPLLSAAAAAALSLTACSQTSEETTQTSATDTGADTGAMGADASATDTAMPDATDTGAMAGTMDDGAGGAMAGDTTSAQGFVNTAAASDMYEIQAGKLAQQKGKSQAVKDFGKMMVSDHTKSTADLKAAASQANVTPAPQMSAKQKSDMTALEGAGDNFDKIYAQQQVAAHEQALALMKSEASGGDAASLKAFATKTAPVIEKHLALARKLP